MVLRAVGTRTVRFDKWRMLVSWVGVVVGLGGCAAAPTPQPRVVAVNKAPNLMQGEAELPQARGVESEEEVLYDSLSAEQVAAVVGARSSAVGGCHVVEYSGRVPEAGFVVVELEIERTGAVSNAAVSESSYKGGDLPSCVASVASGLTFPKAARPTQVSWRFDFKGR